VRGVVFFVGPGAHLIAFRAPRSGEQLLEVGESARATAVLRRARALAAGERNPYLEQRTAWLCHAADTADRKQVRALAQVAQSVANAGNLGEARRLTAACCAAGP
jgi:hypothetical protein